MTSLLVEGTSIRGVKVVRREQKKDHRGHLERLFCSRDLASILGDRQVKQVNHTYTKRAGTIRGMHYQLPPHCETKLVSCLTGAIWDVAVDVRSNSPTFLAHHCEMLSARNQTSLLLPEGVAHGFQTMSEDCNLIYIHTELYEPESEMGLNPFDEKLNIRWPMKVTEVSERDKSHQMLTGAFTGLHIDEM